jgi:pimeloyl-ACP methyl ester carboxylesterase
MTRRQALAFGLVGAAAGLGGCSVLRRNASTAGASGELTSAHWPGQSARWRMALPDPARLPHPRLVVALHGKGGNADDAFDGLHLGEHADRLGLAVASVDGGDRYWHARRAGDDTGAMVIEDLLPTLRDAGAGPAPVGLIGWSMGGYGALWLGARYGRGVVGAVAAMSAALWTSPGASAPGAFDDRADFLAHDVFARVSAFAGMPVRLDCGTSDPFIAADRAFAATLGTAEATFDSGGHDDAYWQPHGIQQLEWFARTLPATASANPG